MQKLKKTFTGWVETDPRAGFAAALHKNINQDFIGLLAAGIAFYFLLAAFPAIAALISLYGLFSDPQFIADQFALLDNFLPREAVNILADQARSIIAAGQGALGLSFFISTGLTVYSATKGVNALMGGLNIAYNLNERRNFVKRNANAFILTLVMMIYFIVSLSLVAVLPAVIHWFRLPWELEDFVLRSRWLALFAMAMGGLEILYSFGPAWPRARWRWRWFSFGSLTATVLWLGVSSLFSVFVTHFGSYNETYGSLGAVVVLLLWFWLSALTILFGAEINATVSEVREVQ